MTGSALLRFDVIDEHHGAVPCAAVVPPGSAAALPLCLFLSGGGGSRESLAEIQRVLESWWASGAVPPMVVATPDPGGLSFYLDDPERGQYRERFVAGRFVRELRERFLQTARTSLCAVGVSMGGYGALKLALQRPAEYAAVAAISPMIEPAFEAARVPLRNRYHYTPEVPQALLGPERDPALYERDQPIARARRNAAELRASALAIYIDAAGRDAVHAHDGAEHLHRVLWQLDVAHEYRLRRDSDHMGPDFLERMREAFAWIGSYVCPRVEQPLSATERPWRTWLDGDRSAAPPATPVPPTSALFPAMLRAHLAGLRDAAAAQDETFDRCYGRLPDESRNQ